MGAGAGSRRNTVLDVLRPQDFIGVCRLGGGQFWKTGLCVINFQKLGYTSSISLICQAGQFLALDGQSSCRFLRTVWAVGQEDLVVVTSHSVNISRPGCIPYQLSGFLAPCLDPIPKHFGSEGVHRVISTYSSGAIGRTVTCTRPHNAQPRPLTPRPVLVPVPHHCPPPVLVPVPLHCPS
jgi:hypothetical protein